MSNHKYTITGAGENGEKAIEEFYKKLGDVNSKLNEKKVGVLRKIVDSKYTIDCKVAENAAPDFTSKLSNTYNSKESFDDAKSKADKGYGKIPFTVQTCSLTQSYKLSSKQQKILFGAEKPPTPAGNFDYRNDDITQYLM